MALPLQQALLEVASGFQATLAPNQPAGRFALSIVAGPPGSHSIGSLKVSVDQGTEMVMKLSNVDLKMVVKQVRFVDDATDGRALRGGMPISDVGAIGGLDAASSLQGSAAVLDLLKKLTHGPIVDPVTKVPEPGVPGLLGSLTGTLQLPMEVAKTAADVPVTAEARITLRTEKGEPAGGVTWSGPKTESLSSIELTGQQLQQQLVGTLAAFTHELGVVPEVVKRYVHVEIRVSAMGADSGWVPVEDKLEVTVPAIPVPTLVCCFRFSNLGGNAFVLLHPDNPIPTEDEIDKVLEQIKVLRDTVSSLSSSLTVAATFLGYLLWLEDKLTTAHQLRDGVKVRKGSQLYLNTITLQVNLLNDMEAEDEISSILMIGPSGRTVKFYNADEHDDSEGQMNVTIGNELYVLIRDTESKTPGSEPGGRVHVAKLPGLGGIWPANYERTFHNEISSVKFP